MSEELLPCECGGRGWMQRRDDAPLCRITCNACPRSTAWLSDAEAIAAWNTRPTPPSAGDAEVAKELLWQLGVTNQSEKTLDLRAQKALEIAFTSAIAQARREERERAAEIFRQMAENARQSFPGTEEQRIHAYDWLHDAKLAIRADASQEKKDE